MKKTKETMREFQESLGMFDLFKGIGVIGVIIFHSISSFSFDQAVAGANIFVKLGLLIFMILGSALMPAFFVASGYGFRQQNTRLIKKKVRLILVPYMVMATVTVILHFVLHYGAFHYLRGTVKESIKVIVGFLLALSSNMDINGINFYNCGIGWYLISLLGVTILLNVFSKYGKDKAWIFVMISTIMGIVIGFNQIYLFCIPQILTGMFFFYEGYLIKTHKLLYRRWNWKWSMLFCLSILLTVIGVVYTGQMDNIAEGRWNFLLLSVISDGVLAFFCLYILLFFNKLCNRGFVFLKRIGSKSLILFCVHSIEMKAVPWYIFTDQWTGSPFVGCCILVMARCLAIFVGYKIFLFVHKHIWRKMKRNY